MQKKFKFIVVEGIDGVGKTTLCRSVQRELQASGESCFSLYGVPEPFSSIAAKVPSLKNVTSRYHFYLAANICLSDSIRILLQTGHVIVDRYAYSTFAYHVNRGAEGVNPPAFSDDGLLRPDINVFLSVADEQIRRQRLHTRGALTQDDLEIKVEGSFSWMVEETYRRLGLIEIDNTSHGSDSALRSIMNLVSDTHLVS